MRCADRTGYTALQARPQMLGVPRTLAIIEVAVSFYALLLFGPLKLIPWGGLGLWWFFLHPLLRSRFEQDRLSFYLLVRSFARPELVPALRRYDKEPPRRRATIRKLKPGGG